MKKADGFLLLYDITNPASFDALQTLKAYIDAIREPGSYVLVVGGTKTDLERTRQVRQLDAEALASQWDALFYETSSAYGIFVTELFHGTARLIWQRTNAQPPTQSAGSKMRNCALL